MGGVSAGAGLGRDVGCAWVGLAGLGVGPGRGGEYGLAVRGVAVRIYDFVESAKFVQDFLVLGGCLLIKVTDFGLQMAQPGVYRDDQADKGD